MREPQWPDIELDIEAYFAKRYGDNKYNLKRDYWTVKAGETRDVDAIRCRPPLNVEQSYWEANITFWLDLKNVARAATNAQNKARSTTFSRHGSRSLVVCRHQYVRHIIIILHIVHYIHGV
ncbi:hypothetical protein Tco_0392271 [Tanacetum coccineum]